MITGYIWINFICWCKRRCVERWRSRDWKRLVLTTESGFLYYYCVYWGWFFHCTLIMLKWLLNITNHIKPCVILALKSVVQRCSHHSKYSMFIIKVKTYPYKCTLHWSKQLLDHCTCINLLIFSKIGYLMFFSLS